MAADITSLIVEVKSVGIKDASMALSGLGTSALNAEKKINALIEATKKLNTINETAVKAFVNVADKLREQDKLLSNMAATSRNTASGMKEIALAMLVMSKALEQIAQGQNRAERAARGHNEAMREAHALARGLSGSLGALWLTYGNITGMAIGVSIGAGLKSIVSIGKDVENTLEGIRIRAGESQESMNKVAEAVERIGKGVYGPQEVAKAFETLALAGLKAKDSTQAIGAALNLATAGGTSIEKAAESLVTIGTAVGATAKEFDMLADGITTAANTSLASVDSIAEAVKRASVVNKLYGASFDDILTQTAALAQLGIKNTAAGTAIVNFYNNSLGQTEKSKKALDALGMSFTDLNGKAKPVVEAFEEFTAKLNKFDLKSQQTLINDIFGERALRDVEAMRDLVNTTAEDTAKYSNRLREIQGEIAQAAGTSALQAAMLGLTTSKQMESVGNTLKVSLSAAFEEVSPVIREVSDRLKEVFSSPEFIRAIANVASGIADITASLVENYKAVMYVADAFILWKSATVGAAFFSALATGITGVATAMGIATTATTAFGTALRLLPGIGAVLSAVTAAIYLMSLATEDAKNRAVETAEAYNKDFLKALSDEAERLDRINELTDKGATAKEAQAQATREVAMAKLMEVNADAVAAAQAARDKAKQALDDKVASTPSAFSNIKPEKETKALAAAQETLNNALDAYSRTLSDAQIKTQQIEESSKRQRENFLREAEERGKAAKDLAGKMTFGGDKPNKAAINDAYGEAIATQIAIIKAAKKDIENYDDALNDQFKAGIISRMRMVDSSTAYSLHKYKEVGEAINKNIASAQGKENGKTALATFEGQAEANAEAMAQAERKRSQELAVFKRQLVVDTTRDRIKELEAEGQYVEAAEKRWSIDYSNAVKEVANAVQEYGDKLPEAAKRLQQLTDNQKAFMEAANVRQLSKEFDELYMSIGNGIKGVQTASEDQGLAAMWDAAQKAADDYKAKLPDLQAKLEKIKAVAEAPGATTAAKTEYQDELSKQKALAEKYKTMWTDVGKAITDNLTNAFGKSGKSAGQMINTLLKYQNEDNKTLVVKAHAYGDLASSAQGFFSESSKGYKILGVAAQAAYAIETASAIASIGPKVAAGVASLFAQGGFAGFAAAGAFLALMAGLGFSGGGGGVSSQQRQQSQGTGSVLGDSTAKSDSIQKSLDNLVKDSGLGLVHSNNAEKYLKNISDNIGSLASLIVRTTGLNGDSAAGVTEGTRINSSWTTGLGPLAGVAEKIPVVGKLLSKLFGATTTLVDQGIQLASASIAQIQQSGINAQSYATVNTKKKFFGISYSNKTSDQLSSLDPSVSQQFGLLIDSMAQSIEKAAKSLGLGGDAFTQKLQSFVVDIGKISFKGMTGAEIEKTLQNVFSKLGDDMAAFAVDGLTKFQKVGEGALETLTRVANDLVQVQDVFATLGKSMNVTGMAAVELSESLIDAFGSVEKLTESTKYFVDNFYTDAEKLAPIQKSLSDALTSMGLSANLSSDEFKKLVMSQDLTTVSGQEMFAALLNIAPAIKAVTDATEAATKAEKELLSKRLGMELTIAQLEKNTEQASKIIAAQRRIELDSLDASLRPLQERIYQLNDEAEALQKANEIRDKSLSMQIQIATLEKNTSRVTELVAAQRAIELANMDASLRPMQIRINQLTDEATATQKSNDLRDKSLAMQIQIQQLEQNTAKVTELVAAQRAIELSNMDESLKPMQIRINQLNDEIAATQKSNDLRDKSLAMQIQIQQLEGNSARAAELIAAQRSIELSTMDKSLQPLQIRINQLNDEKAATEKTNATASLHAQAMTLQGKTQEALAITRGIELSKLSATDKALQQYIYTLEDSQQAYESSRSLQIALLEQLGRKEEALALTRADALKNLSEEDKAYQQAIYDSVDSVKAATDSFAVLSKAVEAQKKANQDAYDNTVKGIESQENATKTAFESLKTSLEASVKTAEDASKAYDDLSKALANAISSALEDTVFAMTRKMAQAQLDSILNTARTTGKLPTAESMQGVLGVLSKSSTDGFSTLEEFNKDVGITANKLNDLKVITDSAKSVQDMQLEAMKSLLETSQAAYDAQVQAFADAKEAAKLKLDADNAALDKTLENAQMQLDVLNNTYVAIQSIDKALATYNTSVLAALDAQKNAVVAPPSSSPASAISSPAEDAIKNLYKVILGRDADKAGLSYWEKMMATGTSLSDVAGFLFSSPEYINGSHANGLDEVPFDGYRAELHKGEKVLTAKQSKGVAQAEDIKAVVEAINSLKDDNSAENQAMVSDIRWIKKLFQNVSPNGQTLQVTQTVITT